jgi:hypothetical protein
MTAAQQETFAKSFCNLRDNAAEAKDRLSNASSLAAALKHILKSMDGRHEKPLVSAIELALRIEEIAHAEAERAAALESVISRLPQGAAVSYASVDDSAVWPALLAVEDCNHSQKTWCED